MKPILRFKELYPKSYGACERCNEKPATLYGITDGSGNSGKFICRRCLPGDATEFSGGQDMYVGMSS